MRGWKHSDQIKGAAAKSAAAQPGIDAFAEMLADGYSMGQAARDLGKSQAWSTKALAKIRAGLGWQAA